MRSLSPGFLAVVCGLAGFLSGALAAMFAFYFLGRMTGGADDVAWGEHAALHGLVCGLLGLFVGGWAGFRMGSRSSSR